MAKKSPRPPGYTPRENRLAARLVITRADRMDPQTLKAVVLWLQEQAVYLRKHAGELAVKFEAKCWRWY